MRSVAALLALVIVVLASQAAALERLPAVLHVHSDLSTGDFSLEQLGAMAEKQGIGALLVTENYLLRVQYGLPPFRALTHATREERSVLPSGVERYLERVARARVANPRVLIVPGVEVLPHYHWTGSPLALDMVVHNTQKNLLVFGVTDAAVLRALPVTGNPNAGAFGWASAIDILPAALVVPGALLLLRKHRSLRRRGRAVIVETRRAWLPGVMLCSIGLLALVRGWPFVVDPYPPYEDLGVRPHQELIDYVDRAGGATVWSLPEARDDGEQWFGPIRVAWRTRPYPDDLLRTARYTAFGAVYEDTTHVERPGGSWDRMLSQAILGDRSRPAWAVGESGFHDFSAGKGLGNVQTVFLVEERSERAVIDALRRGRMYALQRERDAGLVLGEFEVRSGAAVAVSGDTLRAAQAAPLEVSVLIEAAGGASRDVRVTLVRNGATVEAWTGPTPIRAVHRERFDGAPAFYRLDVRGAGRLLSNPIFVKRR